MSVFIIAISIHFYLANQYSSETMVKKFSDAVRSKDLKTAKMILGEHQKGDLTEEDVKGMISYIQDEWSSIDGLLMSAAKSHSEEPIIDSRGNKILQIVPGEKKFGLYHQYYLQPLRIEVQMKTNLDHVKVTDGKQMFNQLKEANTYETIGEYFPGTLKKVTASFKGEYANLTAETEIDFKEAKKNELKQKIKLNGAFIPISSNRDEALLFVNGRNSRASIKEINQLGPIATDGSVTIHAELRTANGMIKSNEVEVVGEEAIVLNFNEEDLLALQDRESSSIHEEEGSGDGEYYSGLASLVSEFMYASVDAYNYRDFSLVEGYMNPSGPIYKKTQEYIDYLDKKGIYEELLNVNFIQSEDTRNGVNITTQEEYKISYGNGSMKFKKFETKQHFRWIDGKLLAHELIYTKELYSKNM
ncbi:putative membrane protein YvbJ [Oikeobacillus pervagus]|uniref:Membrane protein YvbJ n=1 Tax=Oikeobacillus pervagus TaxID=1325931 RepID=A0AAJ1WFL9_9BACI|nr:hypothetical protein [Oikeobacillus pervagus]MDQ0214097.1 putative membrane protein YvbJ [Oikeobacillus pervagus]